MKLIVKKGRTSLLVRIFIQDSSSTVGAGLTGLTNASGSLVCYVARDDDGNAAATQLSLSAGTRGTWSSGGFKEKDATNMPGVYELGISNAAIATGSESCTIMLKGATNMAPCVLEIQLVAYDPQDSVHLGLTCLPNTAVTTNASLLTSGTGTDQLSVTSGRIDIGKALGTAVTLDSNNVLNVSAKYVGGTLLTARDIGASVLLSAGSGTGQLDFTSGVVKGNVTQWSGTTVATPNTAGVPVVDTRTVARVGTAQTGATTSVTLDAGASATTNFYVGMRVHIISGTGAPESSVITAYNGSTKVATIASTWPTAPDNTSVFLITMDAKNDVRTISGGNVNTGAAQIGVNVVNWNASAVAAPNVSGVPIVDAGYVSGTAQTARDLGASVLVAGDFSATMKTSLNAATPASVTGAVGSVTGNVGGNVVGSVGSVTGLTASNLDATVSSRMATYTQPTGFLAATFPSGTVANTTNITAGTITTATNLTNAPTAGDFTAAMKTSLNAATPAVTVSDKTGFSLTSAYDFAKGTTAMTESYAANGAAPTAIQAMYAIHQMLMDFSIGSTTYTVKKLDNATTAFVVTLNDATSPTAAART